MTVSWQLISSQYFFIKLYLSIMGVIVKISAESSPSETKKALEKLPKNQSKKTLKEYFGKLPGAFGDGLEYQKKVRNDWE